MLPTIKNTPLRHTSRGYVRQIGSLDRGKGVAKFQLGHDVVEAAKRRKWVEAVWLENCRVSLSRDHFLIQKKDGSANYRWLTEFLDTAKQFARHGSAVIIPDGSSDYTWVARLRELGAPIFIEGKANAVTVLPEAVVDGKPATIKLFDVLESYKTDRINSYTGAYAGTQRVEKQLEKIKENLTDCYIANFGYSQIKQHVDYWRARPKTKHGTPCSKTYAQNQIGEFYKFLRWANNTCKEFALPDLDSIDRTVARISNDTTGNSIAHRFWQPEELKAVYKTAQPMAKLIIALGLNTCGGSAELGRFRIDDFHFDCQHPQHKLIKFDRKADWLITTRHKTHSYSVALLWPWVADLVKEQIAICKANKWKYLFTDDGEPLYLSDDVYQDVGLPSPNTTKPESRFVKRYNNAVKYALDHKAITNKHSIGKLRKTFSNYLTMENHGDLGSLALSHQTDTDQLLKHYANKPYARLFNATLEHENHWNLVG